MKRKRRSTKQIIHEILNLTTSKGWAFRVVRQWNKSVMRPKKSGHPAQRGKQDIIEFRCAQSGTLMEVHIDRFTEGKIRFRGVDPFKDTGPFYKPPRTHVDIDKATDEQKARLKEMIDAEDREGVIAYLKEIGLLPQDEVVPEPQEIQDEDLPDPEELLAIAAQANAEIAQGADEHMVMEQAITKAKQAKQAKQAKRMEQTEE